MQAEMAHAEYDWWQDQIFQVTFLFVQASKPINTAVKTLSLKP